MPIYFKRTESSLITAVGRYLQNLENAGRIKFWNRQQAGAIPFQRKGKWQSIRLGRPGVSDIWCILDLKIDGVSPKMIWIECKLENSKQSVDQIKFQELVEKNGHYYWLIHDCDELEIKFKQIGII